MRTMTTTLMILIAIALTGCGKSEGPGANGPSAKLPEGLMLAAAPGDAKNLIDVKATAKEGDVVTIKAVVGGTMKPFVENRAIVQVIDPSQQSCRDIPGDTCPTPWDYCCVPQEELTKNMATIQVVDAAGQPLKIAFDQAKALKPLDEIIVTGKVGPRPDPNVLVINVTGIYISGTRMK
ncbi:MAG: hypothetical protein WD768_22365 [Phycisphaeraceae bacterium]